jgi:hypothetical protein
MPRPPPDLDRLARLLQARGATASRAIAGELGVSQATLTRMVAGLGSSIERIGAARSTRYALRRPVRNLGSEWPVYRINASGRHHCWGTLRALHPGFRFQPGEQAPSWMEREYGDGQFPGLPFFLQDLQPQGYLGRAIAREVAPRLGVPPDIRLWSDDDALSYLLTDGQDLPGDLVLGDHALERAVRAPENPLPVAHSDRVRVYPERALAAQRGEVAGSSAGGEQPKFLASVVRRTGEIQAVIVKFSVADRSPVATRWADLLSCEHLAAETIRDRKFASAGTEVLDAGGRRFLEVSRFDRVGAAGRRGVLSLGALEDAFLDRSSANWAATAVLLEQAQLITPEDARTLRWIWCFGDLIANSDMHRANVAFWFTDTLPCRVAPCYDMLPMLYAPGPQGDLDERPFSPRPPLASVADVWSDAAGAALVFWERVSTGTGVSGAFRAIARNNHAAVARMLARFG